MEGFDELVQAQQGLILWRQGVAILGRRGFDRRVANDTLIKEHCGLYRVAGVPITDRLVLYAATLVCDGVGSFEAAGYFHGFDSFDVFRPVVTTLHASASRKITLLGRNVTVHRTNCLPAEHQGVFFGVPMTTPARTICDLSWRFGTKRLLSLADEEARRRRLTYAGIAECRNDLRARGRRRTTVLDEVLARRGFDVNLGESAPELDVRTILEDAGIAPEVQVDVTVAGRKRRLDLAYVPEKIAVEYQGIDEHGNEVAVITDSQRTTELQLAGWLVVLVTKATTRRELVATVREALSQRRPTPPST